MIQETSKGVSELWAEIVLDASRMSSEHISFIRTEYRNGLVASFWSRIKPEFEHQREICKLSKKDLARRIGCADSFFSEKNWPSSNTPLWLPLALSIALDLPLTKPNFAYRPKALRLDGYEYAIRAIANEKFSSALPLGGLITEGFLSDCRSVLKIHVLSVLVAFRQCDFPEEGLTLKQLTYSISKQIRSQMDSILDGIDLLSKELNIPHKKVGLDEFQDIQCRYSLPMMIVLAGLKYDNDSI
jgi:hypothetical protein